MWLVTYNHYLLAAEYLALICPWYCPLSSTVSKKNLLLPTKKKIILITCDDLTKKHSDNKIINVVTSDYLFRARLLQKKASDWNPRRRWRYNKCNTWWSTPCWFDCSCKVVYWCEFVKENGMETRSRCGWKSSNEGWSDCKEKGMAWLVYITDFCKSLWTEYCNALFS